MKLKYYEGSELKEYCYYDLNYVILRYVIIVKFFKFSKEFF